MYIDLPCRNAVIIMQYIIYSILQWSQNTGPLVCVLGCDIARGPTTLWLYHIPGKKSQGPIIHI